MKNFVHIDFVEKNQIYFHLSKLNIIIGVGFLKFKKDIVMQIYHFLQKVIRIIIQTLLSRRHILFLPSCTLNRASLGEALISANEEHRRY